jgi:GxxExxY protein
MPTQGGEMTADEIAKDIVDGAMKVHRALGPGLLESAYQACLAHELRRRERRVECEVALPLEFEGALIEVGCRIDMRIDQLVLVENKTVEKILPIHLAQLLTYLKLSGLSLGLIINWNVILLRDGLQRVVRNHPEELRVGTDRWIRGRQGCSFSWRPWRFVFLVAGEAILES